MFYIIEGDNGKFLGMKEEVEFFLVSEMENATVLNKSSLDGLLKWKEQDGEIKTEDGSMKIAYIHTLGTTTKSMYTDFIQNRTAPVSYDIGDIVDFDGYFYEVEGVTNNTVQLSHEGGPDFSPEFEFVKLVCKAENRMDK